MSNPLKNTVRELSQRYHLSMKRVDAILRLKGMEAAWIKVCVPLPLVMDYLWSNDVLYD